MERNRFSKRGFTLMELTIVIALVAVIGAVVISFAVLMNKHANQNKFKLALMREIQLIETIVEDQLNGEKKDVKVTTDGKLTVGGETAHALEAVAKLSCDDSRDNIYFYTITDIKGEEYVFVVYPRVGGETGGA